MHLNGDVFSHVLKCSGDRSPVLVGPPTVQGLGIWRWQSGPAVQKLWSTEETYEDVGEVVQKGWEEGRRTLRPVWNGSVTNWGRGVKFSGFWSQTAESESCFYHFSAVRACATKSNKKGHAPSCSVLEQCLVQGEKVRSRRKRASSYSLLCP